MHFLVQIYIYMGLSEHGKKATSPGRSILFLPKKDKQRLHSGSNFCHGWTAPHVSARPLEYGEFANRRGGVPPDNSLHNGGLCMSYGRTVVSQRGSPLNSVPQTDVILLAQTLFFPV